MKPKPTSYPEGFDYEWTGLKTRGGRAVSYDMLEDPAVEEMLLDQEQFFMGRVQINARKVFGLVRWNAMIPVVKNGEVIGEMEIGDSEGGEISVYEIADIVERATESPIKFMTSRSTQDWVLWTDVEEPNVKPKRKSDLLREQERPEVFGYELDRRTLTPVRKTVVRTPGDYGADPLGDGRFRMVPSGDIVGLEERKRRLKER